MAEEEDSYGKTNKRIVFTDTDHRHAQLIIRLKHDGLRQSQFFRSLIGGYLEGDHRIQSFILEKSTQSQKHKAKSSRLSKQGSTIVKGLGFNEGEIDNIFDLIEKEHPEL
jgi:hypothetical protein